MCLIQQEHNCPNTGVLVQELGTEIRAIPPTIEKTLYCA